MNNNTRTTPKDFFLHLAATIVLYVSVGALIDLSFSVINYAFPDALANYFYTSSIVWPISLLVILIPVLYLLEWFIARDLTSQPEKKDLWIRKWRIYLTIFLGAALVLGDLIALLNTYLNGEITMRFVYKIIVILLVGGTVSKYYFFSLNDKFRFSTFVKRVYPWFGVALVLAAIVSGFVIVGSPAKQRAMRFDNQRISDLTTIQWQIVNIYQQKGTIPTELAALNDSIMGVTVPTDPDTRAPYEYVAKGKTSFDLCATFSLVSQDTSGRGAYAGNDATGSGVVSYPSVPGGIENSSWAHAAGHVCFTRTIDPSRYPVTPGTIPTKALY